LLYVSTDRAALAIRNFARSLALKNKKNKTNKQKSATDRLLGLPAKNLGTECVTFTYSVKNSLLLCAEYLATVSPGTWVQNLLFFNTGGKKTG
jgi:hypothetical protein